jgi:ABC-2 type transport system permease protein
VLSTIGVIVPAVLLPWLIVSGTEVTPSYLWSFLAGASAGAAAYCAIFLVLGLTTRRALVIGLLYVIAFEGIMSRSLAGLKSLSVREFTVSISQAVSRGAVVAGATVPMSTVYTVGGIVLAGAMLMAFRRLGRYELAERL